MLFHLFSSIALDANNIYILGMHMRIRCLSVEEGLDTFVVYWYRVDVRSRHKSGDDKAACHWQNILRY